jgi:hypothetical protein
MRISVLLLSRGVPRDRCDEFRQFRQFPPVFFLFATPPPRKRRNLDDTERADLELVFV